MKQERTKKKQSFYRLKRRLNRRIFFIGVLFLLGIGYMIYRITYIKVVLGEEYQKAVYNRVMEKEQEMMPQRGYIVDRNDKIIAASAITYHIILDPKALLECKEKQRQNTYQILSKYLGKKTEELTQLVGTKKDSRYVVLEKNVPKETVQKMKEEGAVAITYEESFLRQYPKGEFASQVIGFYNKNGQGQYGIEQAYNDYMQGKPGRIFSQMQSGEIVSKVVKSPENGSKIVLTLDAVVQQYVEQVMKKYILETKPLNAAAIFMNPNTGEIYSMFSYPTFDPNSYNNLEKQLGKDVWSKLKDTKKAEALNRSWKNYTIQNPYEPGSTFKPIATAIAIEEGLIDLNATYVCNGYKEIVPGQIIHCWKREGHGKQTLEQALANSCNVALMDISEKVPAEVVLEHMRSFGFGEITNIDLSGEEAGLLHKKLGPVEKATYFMGQSFTCTPLQLTTAFSAVINGGYLLEPYIVSQAVQEEKGIVYENEPKIKRQVISKETSDIIRNYLEKVITSGTGTHAAMNGYRIGGKTGTAEKLPRGSNKHILSFMGYAPIQNPQIIGLIIFDEIPEGTGTPAKAFKEIMTNVLPYLEIAPSKVNNITDSTVKELPNLEGKNIYEAYNTLTGLGLKMDTIGVGSTIISQYPKPGIYLPDNSTIKLYVETKVPESLIQVPDLTGQTVAQAKVMVGKDFVIKGPDSGKIVKQMPKKGQKVEKTNPIIVQTSQ